MKQQQKMGTVFLAGVAYFGLFLSGLSYAGQILLPENPRPIRPPSRGEAGANEDYERKRKAIDEKIDREQPVPPSPEQVRDRELLKEALTPTPLNYGFTASLLYNFVRTSGGEREDYTAEPSAHIALFYRPTNSSDSSNLNLWLGARAYYVGGTGAYNGINGRYSFAYYGPMIGLGKFDPGPSSVGQDAAASPSSGSAAIPARSAYFLLTGVAAQSRQSVRETGSEEPEDDLDNQAIAFDSPGIWAEVWYASLRYNAISLQTFAGAQSGDKKIFIYLGIGVGGWR